MPERPRLLSIVLPTRSLVTKGARFFTVLLGSFAFAGMASSAEVPEIMSNRAFFDFCADPNLSQSERVALLVEDGWSIVEFDPAADLDTSSWSFSNPQQAAFIGIVVSTILPTRVEGEDLLNAIESRLEDGGERWFMPFRFGISGNTFFKDKTLISVNAKPSIIDGGGPHSIKCNYFGKMHDLHDVFPEIESKVFELNDFQVVYRYSRSGVHFSNGDVSIDLDGGYTIVTEGARLSEIFGVEDGDRVFSSLSFNFER